MPSRIHLGDCPERIENTMRTLGTQDGETLSAICRNEDYFDIGKHSYPLHAAYSVSKLNRNLTVLLMVEDGSEIRLKIDFPFMIGGNEFRGFFIYFAPGNYIDIVDGFSDFDEPLPTYWIIKCIACELMGLEIPLALPYFAKNWEVYFNFSNFYISKIGQCTSCILIGPAGRLRIDKLRACIGGMTNDPTIPDEPKTEMLVSFFMALEPIWSEDLSISIKTLLDVIPVEIIMAAIDLIPSRYGRSHYIANVIEYIM